VARAPVRLLRLGLLQAEAACQPRLRRRLEEKRDDHGERHHGEELRLLANPFGDEHAHERGGDDARLARPGEEGELLAAPVSAPVGQEAEDDRRGRARRMRPASVARAGRASSAIASKGRLAPRVTKTRITTTSAVAAADERISSSRCACMPRRSSFMLPTMKPARKAPR
jgi:hypothetical protein